MNMHILITNHSFKLQGGTEMFSLDLGTALRKQGHKISYFTPDGKYTNHLFKEQLQDVYNTVEDLPNDIDVIHLQHGNCAKALKDYNKPKLYVRHGVMDDIEVEPKDVQVYVAVSEEVRDAMQYPAVVINNPVNTDKFFEEKKTNDTLKNLLILSNHFPEYMTHTIQSVCDELAIKLEKRGYIFDTVDYTALPDTINEADCVISYGRGIYESMACGRTVIVAGKNGVDGLITDKQTYKDFIYSNCSGRYKRDDWTREDWLMVFKMLKQGLPKFGKDYLPVEQHLFKVVDKYIKLYDEARRRFHNVESA